jgi:hypothetical protein
VLAEAIIMRTLSQPVTMSPEAAARVAKLELQQVVDDLITRAYALLPGLQSIQLSLVPSYEMDDIPWLVLECSSARPEREARDGLLAWYTWRADNLPFEVARRFMLDWIQHQETHEG